jgi:hypothetical protein
MKSAYTLPGVSFANIFVRSFLDEIPILITERLIKRIFKRADIYLQNSGIHIVIKQITTKPEMVNADNGTFP